MARTRGSQPPLPRGLTMTDNPFDTYLAGVQEPQRSTLEAVRAHVHALYPDVEECTSYGVPAFRIDGVVVAGLAARTKGCSYYPMSGSLLDAFDVKALGYTRSTGALQFSADVPLPRDLVRQLISARLAQR